MRDTRNATIVVLAITATLLATAVWLTGDRTATAAQAETNEQPQTRRSRAAHAAGQDGAVAQPEARRGEAPRAVKPGPLPRRARPWLPDRSLGHP